MAQTASNKHCTRLAGILHEYHNLSSIEQEFKHVGEPELTQLSFAQHTAHKRMSQCRVKFGAFYEYLSEQQDGNFDRIASGHYARILRADDPHEPVGLALAPDPVKDQTYFLAHLSQIQLSKVMFPLGHLTKVTSNSCHALAE